jgi:hypothetical protein
MYIEKTNPWQVNYDENEIPPYTLPDVLTCFDGSKVTTKEEWVNKRRVELLQEFKNVMYGELPPLPDKVDYSCVYPRKLTLNNLAYKEETKLTFKMNNGKSSSATLLLYTPANVEKAPVFVGLTFVGLHASSLDPEISITGHLLPNFSSERGTRKENYPIEDIVKRGYAVALLSCNEIFPDHVDGWKDSIFKLFYNEKELKTRLKNTSCISAWAWGVSRMLDYLKTLPYIDSDTACVYGHSRLGKTALWCGVNDTRFKLVCVNNSGCGGAALSRRLFGETLCSMHNLSNFGKYWFTDTLESKAMQPDQLPIDQHELIALVAPRCVSVHSATEDLWADPKGEYLSTYYAGCVWELFNKTPLTNIEQPEPTTPVGSDVSYYLRIGRHALVLEDWNHYMDIADYIFKK